MNALAFALAMLVTQPLPTSAPSATPSPAPSGAAPGSALPPGLPSAPPAAAAGELLVRGRYLTCERGFIVLTNGAALRLQSDAIAFKGKLGETIRLHVDASTHAVSAVDRAPREALPGEIEIGAIPAGFATALAEAPAHGAANGTAAAATVTVTIVARVPDDTPLGDDVYLSTDRSGFSPNELRLVRVDSRYWTVDVTLPQGSALHYRFTRGSFATGERDRSGALVLPHALTATPKLRTADTIERWADRN